jgi:hypothetical protein
MPLMQNGKNIHRLGEIYFAPPPHQVAGRIAILLWQERHFVLGEGLLLAFWLVCSRPQHGGSKRDG